MQKVIKYLGTTSGDATPGDAAPHPNLQDGQSVKAAPQPMPTGTQTFTPEATRDIEDRPGVYRFYNRNGKLVYVGISATLGERLRRYHGAPTPNPEHSTYAVKPDVERETVYFSYEYKDSIEHAEATERNTISRYNPELNVASGGGWHENPGSGHQ